VSGGNTSHWDTVDLVRSSNKAKTGVELLQENASLSTVSTSEEDAYGSGGEGSTEVTGVLREGLLTVSADLASNRQGWVVFRRTFSSNLRGEYRYVL